MNNYTDIIYIGHYRSTYFFIIADENNNEIDLSRHLHAKIKDQCEHIAIYQFFDNGVKLFLASNWNQKYLKFKKDLSTIFFNLIENKINSNNKTIHYRYKTNWLGRYKLNATKLWKRIY